MLFYNNEYTNNVQITQLLIYDSYLVFMIMDGFTLCDDHDNNLEMVLLMALA